MVLTAVPAAQAATSPAAGTHSFGGIVSLILLFFLLYFGLKLAGTATGKGRPTCAPGVALYAVAGFLAWLGGVTGALGLLYIVIYGILRSSQALRRGVGGKKFAVALLLLVLTLAGCGNPAAMSPIA